jgi:hypothetical protein
LDSSRVLFSLQQVQAEPGPFPAAAGIDPKTVQELLDMGISFLRGLARILAGMSNSRWSCLAGFKKKGCRTSRCCRD